jgi:hypothetical protein
MLVPVAIYYIFKRSKVKGKRLEDNPAVDAARFEEWRRLELRSIDVFLWSYWVTFVVCLLLGFLLAGNIDNVLLVAAVLGVVMIVGLIVSAILGVKPSKTKKELGIK